MEYGSEKIWWTVELEKKPDFEESMKRIYAWYNQSVIDRAPIRFSAHNAEYNEAHVLKGRSWKSLKERWWDTQYQLELFEYQLNHSVFNAKIINPHFLQPVRSKVLQEILRSIFRLWMPYQSASVWLRQFHWQGLNVG
jgi:hypothetical protein